MTAFMDWLSVSVVAEPQVRALMKKINLSVDDEH